jgi:SAM-dependent methyltransferase
MDFYSLLGKYYDDVFPTGQAQKDFLSDAIMPGSKVLDVGCATGGYGHYLGEKGIEVIGIDLDSDMVEKANSRKSENEQYHVLDMRKILQLEDFDFDVVYSLGNTIVHAPSNYSLVKIIQSMYSKLRDNGTLILQIVNYDRIYKDQVTSLKELESKGGEIKFRRSYELEEHEVIFRGEIEEVSTGEKYTSETSLLPVMKETLEDILVTSGFKYPRFFGDFKMSKYTVDSPAIIVVATK